MADFPGADYDDWLQRGMDRGLSDPDELEVEHHGPKQSPRRSHPKRGPIPRDDKDIDW